MSAGLDRFNWIAHHYDALKGLIFGKAIYNSEVCFLKVIPQGANVLILGGGSGEILTALGAHNPACKIWYVEASSEMLAMAAARNTRPFRNPVHFIHGTEKDLPAGIEFDAVITHFFLDLFQEYQILDIGKNIYSRLSRESVWLVSDFVDGGKWWHRVLLWMMYRFFKTSCGIEASALPSWENPLRLAGMEPVAFHLFYRCFIKSAVYRKKHREAFQYPFEV